jgi:molecular chaperone DnaJ
MPGQPGAEAGDLYVEVEVEGHPEFERDGYDIGTRRRVTFADAALGGELEVTLPDDTKLKVDYPAGTQPGQILTVRGKGLPHLDRKARGDVHVMVEVRVPEKLSRKAKKLIEELRAELDGG